MKRIGPALLLGAVALFACGPGQGCGVKVPVVDINAGFTLADAAWFEEEQTMFVFWNVGAEQGLGPESQIEVTWRTDDTFVPWTAISDLPPIHTHLPVLCGPRTMCGSTSIKIQKVPREVGLRLRYHRDGELSVYPWAYLSDAGFSDAGPSDTGGGGGDAGTPLVFNVIGKGPPWTNRSLVVYGVFEETNNTVQWRARHQFPTLRNQQVQDLGLRRSFHIADVEYGDVVAPMGNEYGYGFRPACPVGLTRLPWPPLETTSRAIFDTNTLPLAASASLGVCAQSVVTDAKGTFGTAAMARKNPQVRPAFPTLRSPIKANTEVGFLLRPCLRDISTVHQRMQTQRLILEGSPEICIDNFKDPNFPNILASKLRTRIDAERAKGKDMVLALALHHDDTTKALGAVVEKALEQILPFERDKSSPRVSGAFVFDTFKYAIASPAMRALVLWCPASIDFDDLDKVQDTAQRSCPLLPDFPDLNLGPFRFGNLPILPTRPQYLTFIDKYSESQAGKVTKLGFLAPERTPISENIQVGDFAVATLFNNEIFSAKPTDSFSFCANGDPLSQGVIFRSPILNMPLLLSSLPQLHSLAPAPTYEIGLLWDFPFLTRMDYEFVVAGAVTAFTVTVPFGVSNLSQKYFGTELWNASAFPISKTLLQCTRFCTHPTFDSAGVYNVTSPFDPTFQSQCYLPRFPTPADGDFPRDP